MKQIKHLLCCVLALCMLLSALPMTVHAADVDEDNTTLVENENETERDEIGSTEKDDTETGTGTTPEEDKKEEEQPKPDVIITGSCGQEASWVLNQTQGVLTISGKGIVSNYSADSPAPWSAYADKITSVVVESGITKLGSYAFAGCTKLTKATLADSIADVGSNLFADCTALTEVTLPKNLSTISIHMFDGCTALKTIQLPASVTSIGVGAFIDCKGLTEITIPASVTAIGNTAFSGCSALAKVALNAKITTIAENTFYDCVALTQITIPEGVKTIGSHAFYNCSALAQLSLPKGLLTIGDSAFYNCGALTALTLPDSLTGIGNSAFAMCSKLVTLTLPKKLASIGTSAFSNCAALEQLDFKGDAPNIAADAFTKVTATIFYPHGNTTWTESVLLNYGGTITWQACCEGEHQFDLTGKKDPACTEKGYTGDIACTVCGIIQTKGEDIPALGHDLADVKPVHNSGTKIHTYSCNRCQGGKEEDCTYGDPKIIQEATMGQPGIKQYTCTVCGGTYTVEYTLESTLERIYGANRYKTSFEVADAMKESLGISKFDTVIVANGLGFPDALSGSYLACIKNAPILLTNDKNLDSVKAYITENLKAGGTVYLLGGTVALPKALETDLTKAGYTVTRLAGDNRYETNLAILEEAGVGTKDILVCTGNDFADSLSASALNRPILLVNKTLNAAQKAFLKNLGGNNNIYVIGGTSAVNEALEKDLTAYGKVTRVGGKNRYETSVLVAHQFIRGPQAVVLAYSLNFPDGLCGGPLAYSLGAPLVLTADGKESAAQEYVQRYEITNGIVLGGTGLISDKTVETIFK